MKRCFALVFSLILILSLTACGREEQAPEPESRPSSVSEPAPEDPSQPPQGDEGSLHFSLGPEGEVKILHAGDTLGPWTLESYDAVWDTMPGGLPTVYEANFTAPADRPVELRCSVYLSPFASEERVYFFDVMLEDYDKMPVMEGTNARLWFGSWGSDVLNSLDTLEHDNRWDCRVGVSRYSYSHLAMGAYDLADLAWLEVESTAIEPPVPDGRPSGPVVSEDGMILPPEIPHGIALDGIDFSKLDNVGIASLLEPVLDRARFFCKFGMLGDIEVIGVKVDFSPEAAMELPYQDFGFTRDFYPCLNLPYHTVEELKQDMGTVFAPEVFDNHFQNIFNNITDAGGRIYVYGTGGYSTERIWELDKMEIVSAEKTKLTISAPFSVWGPSDETAVARLNFEIKDGYIVMDDSYFAKVPS